MSTLQKQQMFTQNEIASICDYTFLTRTEQYKGQTPLGKSSIKARQQDFYQFLEKVCNSEVKPYAVCVRSEDVPHARHYLEKNSQDNIIVCAAVGFPDGSWVSSNFKLFEAQYAIGEGAKEVDITLNTKALRMGDHALVLEEIGRVSDWVHHGGGKVKLILETSDLDSKLVIQVCRMAAHAGIDFIKTSTGFGAFGARVEDLTLIKQNWKGGIKISGGLTMTNVSQLLSVICPDPASLDPAKFRVGASNLLP